MGTTTDKLNYLIETKQAIKSALIDKGVEVSDNDTFRSYAEKISNISSGEQGELDFSYYSTLVAPNVDDYHPESYVTWNYLETAVKSLASIYTTDPLLSRELTINLIFQDNVSRFYYGISYEGADCAPSIRLDMSRCNKLTVLGAPDFGFNFPSGLTTLILPESLTAINGGLSYTTELKNLYVPNSVESISSSGFNYLPEGCNVIIDKEPDSIPGAPWGAYYNINITWLRS